MTFFNMLRETGDERTLENKPLQGWVVQPKDPMGLQRVQVRIHDLHDDIEDTDLPWFSPHQLTAHSGNANVGDHGPAPKKGTKIWVQFHDGSQYHGVYGGGVATTQNQIPEFAGSTKAPVSLPGGQAYDFQQNDPWSHGRADDSGGIHAHDNFADVMTNQHVSATGHSVDGKGNFSAVINGDVARPDNPNAKKIHPTGGSVAIFGNLTLFVSGNIAVSAKGNTSIVTSGTTTIDSTGKMQIRCGDEIDIFNNGSKAINISSSTKIALKAPSITSSVAITVADGASPTGPGSVANQTAPSPRTRPNPQLISDDTSY